MLQSTMQDRPLTLTSLFKHGLANFSTSSKVVTCTDGGSRTTTFGEVGEQAGRLANTLAGLGVQRGDRVATFMWNNAEHLAAYFAIPCMGAVLHTLNLRLFPEQLVYIANHAEDRVILVDATLVSMLAKTLPEMKTVEHVIVVGAGDAAASGFENTTAQIHSYEQLLAAGSPDFAWADDIDERAAAAMCYTSGTTGNPKGVVYSHRSNYLHALAANAGSAFGLTERDCVLPIVPMFHVNAWGLPYAAWFAGADLAMPDRFLQGAPLARFIEQARPTISGGVPTIWSDVLRHIDANPTDTSSLRLVVCGGSAVPLSLMKALEERHGIHMVQAWGMTETSPLGAFGYPPKDAGEGTEWEWRVKTGRVFMGVDLRVVDPAGQVLPADGKSVGEFEIAGPWITGSYYQGDDPSRFSSDGWLRTGDVGTLDDHGYMVITDRSKDVIKSGGEWISSVELENALMGHPDVVEAAVVAVPDPRWDERPLATVVLREGASVTAEELREFLAGTVARWQLPERWAFLDAVPKTSVGKFDKKVIRARHSEGELDVVELPPPPK